LPVALPDLETQERITNNIRKLSELRSLVDEISQNLSVNPVSATSMTQQVDEALAVFGKLSAADQVLALIRQGESRSVEFKATFSLPVQSVGSNQEGENKDLRPQLSPKQLRETLETSSLKTIVAFMNSEGGDLLIGVHDNQSINGLNDEIKQLRGNSTDKFLLFFVTKVKDRIGAAWLPHIKHSIVEIDGKSVLRVQCERSQEPAYLDNDVFYIRTNPETTPLKGRDANEYIRRHFPPPTAVLG
jgi:predicted HTH transcriptional regulator